jgi:hypothetical protein
MTSRRYSGRTRYLCLRHLDLYLGWISVTAAYPSTYASIDAFWSATFAISSPHCRKQKTAQDAPSLEWRLESSIIVIPTSCVLTGVRSSCRPEFFHLSRALLKASPCAGFLISDMSVHINMSNSKWRLERALWSRASLMATRCDQRQICTCTEYA